MEKQTTAASIADIEFMQNGEQSQIPETPYVPQIPLESREEEEKETWIIFKMIKKVRAYHLDAYEDVFNPATKGFERIRLLAGVDTIWLKEQKEIDKDYVRGNLRPLKFENGILRISSWDKSGLARVRASNSLVDNPNRKKGGKYEFFEYDPARAAKEALDKEFLELEMVVKAKEMPEEKMLKHAAFLKIQMVDELNRPKGPDGIRKEYMLAAKRNPAFFKRTMDSKEVDIQYMIRAAILDSKIDLGKDQNTAYWGGGGYICRIPQGRKPLDYLVELAMTNSSEGKHFMEQLNQISK